MPAVFSPAFMRCLNNHRSSAATALHTAAKRCLQRIATVRSASAEGGDGHLQAAISAALSRHTGFGAAVVGKAQVCDSMEGFTVQTHRGSAVHRIWQPDQPLGISSRAQVSTCAKVVKPTLLAWAVYRSHQGSRRMGTSQSCRRHSWQLARMLSRLRPATRSSWSSCVAPTGADPFAAQHEQRHKCCCRMRGGRLHYVTSAVLEFRLARQACLHLYGKRCTWLCS